MIARVSRASIITCLQTNDRSWKDRFLFVRGELVWGPRGPSGVSGHWSDTNLFACAGRDYNKALPSGLIAKEWTRELLEIAVGERDYWVALSEINLKSSHMWAFVEENQGIHVLPVDFVLPLLHLRYAIHVVFGGIDL